MTNCSRALAPALLAMLCACGGGGDSGGSSPNGGGVSYVSWNGSANGTVIKDANNEDFAIDASSRNVVALSDGRVLNGATVDSAARVSISGQSIGIVSISASTTGSKIAVFQCNDGSPLDFKASASTWTYSCGAGSPTGGTQGPGSGAGGGSSSSGYVEWNGSSNGALIVDLDNEFFRARAGSGQVEAQNGVSLNGLVVSGSTIVYNGNSIGSVALTPGVNGGNVAAFRCANGNLLNLVVSTNQFNVDCGTSPTNPSPSPTSYITWNGSTNGAFVVDLNNELFRVRAGSGQVETQSGVALSGLLVSGSTVVYNGSSIGSVVLAPGKTGGNVAAFRCSNGNLLNIVVSSSQFTIDCGTTNPTPSPNPTPQPPTPSLPPVASCFSASRTSSTQLVMVNNCPATVYWSVCTRESAVFNGDLQQSYDGVTASGRQSNISLFPSNSILSWRILYQYADPPSSRPSC